MWTKRKIGNLNVWRTGETIKLQRLSDIEDFVETYNQDFGKYDFSQHDEYVYMTSERNQIDRLPSNVYRYERIGGFGGEMALVEFDLLQKESFIDISSSKRIEDDFQKFLDSRQVYEDNRIPFRRGVLLFGPPGTGKSFTIQHITRRIKSDDMIVIFCDRSLTTSYSKALQLDPRIKILIFEEFTNVLNQMWELPEDMLSMLDGEDSLNNSYIIASTNYPERLPPNSIRNGRFDMFYKVSYLTQKDIRSYLTHYKMELSPRLLEKDDLTIASLKEILILTLKNQISVDEALDKIEEHDRLIKAEFSDKKDIGFNTEDKVRRILEDMDDFFDEDH